MKMMFNFHAESNAQVIFKAMKKEIIVADQIACPGLNQDIPKIGPHPNIVKMHLAFSDYVPHLSDSMELYPSALPSRINPNGYGRNMSLFMVMKRYQCNLQEYTEFFGLALPAWAGRAAGGLEAAERPLAATIEFLRRF